SCHRCGIRSRWRVVTTTSPQPASGSITESTRSFRAAVHFDRGDVIRDLVADPFAISLAAPAPVFFIHPQTHPNRPPPLTPELLHQTDCPKRSDVPASIILSAAAHVPRVYMTAEDDNIFGTLASGDFAHHVEAIRVGFHMRAHFEVDFDGHLLLGKTREQ